jgi:hypothetical protein
MASPTVVGISQFLRAIRECFLPPKDDRDILVCLFLHCAEAVIRFFMKGLGFFYEIVTLDRSTTVHRIFLLDSDPIEIRQRGEERKTYTHHRFFKTRQRALKESRVRVRVRVRARASFWVHPQQDYRRSPSRRDTRPRSGGGSPVLSMQIVCESKVVLRV